MKLPTALLVLLALTLTAWAPRVCAQGSIVDAQLEVTTAMVQSDLTLEAVKKADDAKIRGLVQQRDAAAAQRDALAAKVRAGKAQGAALAAANKALSATNDALVAALAATDAEYKLAIDAFRGAVTDIASTPEGLAALARYNAGDQVGALAILDKLQAADEAARQKVADIQKAVGERQIAALALDAREKGKVTTASVIARYEAVVKLDGRVFWDRVELTRLYRIAGRLAEAQAAAEAAVRLSNDDLSASLALAEYGDLARIEGKFPLALESYREALDFASKWYKAHPDSIAAVGNFATVVSLMGEIFREAGDLDGALGAYQGALTDDQFIAEHDPTSAQAARQVELDLANIGGVQQAQGDLAKARQTFDQRLSLAKQLASGAPGDAILRGDLATALAKSADLTLAQGDPAGSLQLYAQSLDIWRELAKADLGNASAQETLAVGLELSAGAREAESDFVGARKDVDEAVTLLRGGGAEASNSAWRRDLAGALLRRAEVRGNQGDLAGARADADEGFALYQALAKADPANPGLQVELAEALQTDGQMELLAGDRNGAKQEADSLELSRRLAAASPGDANIQEDIGIALSHLAAQPDSHVGWTDAAAQWQAMDQKHILPAGDRHYLDEARASAGKEAHK